jgi:hypothetical protein
LSLKTTKRGLRVLCLILILRTIITDYIDEQRREALAPGERVVLDWYRDVNFGVLARERITTDSRGADCFPKAAKPEAGY